MLLREDLSDLLPMVEQANAISQELDRKVRHFPDFALIRVQIVSCV